MSTFIFPHCLESGPYTDWPVAFGGFNGDGLLTYVGPGGTPLPSLRLENFRDGLEDYAYAKLLERKLKELGGDCSQMTTNANCSQIANKNKILPTCIGIRCNPLSRSMTCLKKSADDLPYHRRP